MGKKKGKSKYAKQSNVLSEPIKIQEENSDPNLDLITAALSTANQVVFMKVCRLCETKDGPFLNIFDADKVTAKKIDELMPFGVAENDDLPHKICFRCSAKVEELHEFIQKCIKTQHSLRNAMGMKGPLVTKTKTRALWEEKLNKSNMSNDDICDALIKKAMEGIKHIPLNPSPVEEDDEPAPPPKKEIKPAQSTQISIPKRETRSNPDTTKESDDDLPLKHKKSSKELEKTDESKPVPTRASRSQISSDFLLDGLPDKKRKPTSKQQNGDIKTEEPPSRISVRDFSLEDNSFNSSLNKKEEKPTEQAKPFNIMDHVSMIKVNGVGVLFQCKLCNRNFLKKDVVMSHGCAKTGVPKVDFTKTYIPPEPPKPPVVKYINTNIDNELRKPIVENKFNDTKKEVVDIKKPVENKTKPKIGPASKVRKEAIDHSSIVGMTVVGMQADPSPPKTKASTNFNSSTATTTAPSVNFPSIPSLNSRYKLVPGPNNTFTLVEEPSPTPEPKPEQENNPKPGKKRKSEEVKNDAKSKRHSENSKAASEVIDLEETPGPNHNSNEQPYPVGLFQTLPHHSSVYSPPVGLDPPFTTPAMKKQSYTVVQTGNPSKLLISTKPQPEVEELPKKRQKKSRTVTKPETNSNEPFKVTLEDAAPAKDSGFFTFINVDPLLQPSYVLPTDNIIQESQISTSTSAAKGVPETKDNKYSCNMCDETFSREKKLLSHIQSHYSKMDEEDRRLREKRDIKKRGGKKN